MKMFMEQISAVLGLWGLPRCMLITRKGWMEGICNAWEHAKKWGLRIYLILGASVKQRWALQVRPFPLITKKWPEIS